MVKNASKMLHFGNKKYVLGKGKVYFFKCLIVKTSIPWNLF